MPSLDPLHESRAQEAEASSLSTDQGSSDAHWVDPIDDELLIDYEAHASHNDFTTLCTSASSGKLRDGMPQRIQLSTRPASVKVNPSVEALQDVNYDIAASRPTPPPTKSPSSASSPKLPQQPPEQSAEDDVLQIKPRRRRGRGRKFVLAEGELQSEPKVVLPSNMSRHVTLHALQTGHPRKSILPTPKKRTIQGIEKTVYERVLEERGEHAAALEPETDDIFGGQLEGDADGRTDPSLWLARVASAVASRQPRQGPSHRSPEPEYRYSRNNVRFEGYDRDDIEQPPDADISLAETLPNVSVAWLEVPDLPQAPNHKRPADEELLLDADSSNHPGAQTIIPSRPPNTASQMVTKLLNVVSAPFKRKRGRPKGSKNKVKNQPTLTPDPSIQAPDVSSDSNSKLQFTAAPTVSPRCQILVLKTSLPEQAQSHVSEAQKLASLHPQVERKAKRIKKSSFKEAFREVKNLAPRVKGRLFLAPAGSRRSVKPPGDWWILQNTHEVISKSITSSYLFIDGKGAKSSGQGNCFEQNTHIITETSFGIISNPPRDHQRHRYST